MTKIREIINHENLTPQQKIQREQDLIAAHKRQRIAAISAGNQQLVKKLTESIAGCEAKITAIKLKHNLEQ